MIKKCFPILFLLVLFSCSKKHQPQVAPIPAKKSVTKAAPRRHLPNTLDVPDKVAAHDMDGRLYYDIEGHRYWKNYVDGKYYKFNKAMYNDSAYKPR